MAFPLAAAIGAGVSALGSIFNFSSQNRTNKANAKLAAQQNEWNKEAATLEYERNLEKWNMENEYNAPQMQRQRLVEAGMNPNLAYGSGTVANTAQAAVPYRRPDAQRATMNAPQMSFDPYQAVSFGNALALQKAQKDQMDAQTDSIKQTTANNAIENLIKGVQLSGHKLSLREKEELYSTNVEQAKQQLAKTTQEVKNLRESFHDIQESANLKSSQWMMVKDQARKLRQDYDIEAFKYRLLKLGITDRDNVITRFASRILLANEHEIMELFNRLTGSHQRTTQSSW